MRRRALDALGRRIVRTITAGNLPLDDALFDAYVERVGDEILKAKP